MSIEKPKIKISAVPTKHLVGREDPKGGPHYDDIQKNILDNCAAGVPVCTLKPVLYDKRIAVVGYGPSLAHSWEEIKDYEVIWTCSKAHDFLIDRGIVPTYHTDVDFRTHKAKFNRAPHPDVTYVMSTQVHPDYVKFLHNANVHYCHATVYNTKPYQYPGDYPKIPALWDAGQQCVKFAYELGYKKQDWFGISYSNYWQGSVPVEKHLGHDHAGPHEGFRAPTLYTLTNGKVFETSNAHLAACFGVETMLNTHPDLDVNIYSDGLLLNFLEERAPQIQEQETINAPSI